MIRENQKILLGNEEIITFIAFRINTKIILNEILSTPDDNEIEYFIEVDLKSAQKISK